MTTTTTTPANPTTSGGFPLTTCPRCDGTGHYSYNTMTGSRCFKCVGSGWVIARRAAEAHHAYVTAQQAAKHPTIANVQPGDFIRSSGQEFREVAEIQVTTDPSGWTTRDGIVVPLCFKAVVVYTDGTAERCHTNSLKQRRATVDPAPYLATIKPSRH